MLVYFRSTKTGELIMMSDLARLLLHAIGKQCEKRGVIMAAEIPDALAHLKALIDSQEEPRNELNAEDENGLLPLALATRAWPFIEMLKGTTGQDAHVMWEASASFG